MNNLMLRALLVLLTAMLTAACAAQTPSAPLDSPPTPFSPEPTSSPAQPSAAPTGLQSPAASTATPSAGAHTPAPTDAPTPETMEVKAYFVIEGYRTRDPFLIAVSRPVERTQAVGRAAMMELLAGPGEAERIYAGDGTVGSFVHPDAQLRALSIEDGVATVDLSAEFWPLDLDEGSTLPFVLSVAQVTYTLTQFPTVDAVAFENEGVPMTVIEGHEGGPLQHASRDAYTDQLPPIFIDTPAWGGMATDPVSFAGVAQVFEDRFEAALVDGASGTILVQKTIRSNCAVPCWTPPGGGAFEAELALPADADVEDLRLRVWELEDGRQESLLEYPLR